MSRLLRITSKQKRVIIIHVSFSERIGKTFHEVCVRRIYAAKKKIYIYIRIYLYIKNIYVYIKILWGEKRKIIRKQYNVNEFFRSFSNKCSVLRRDFRKAFM